jgi:hypothetical protein
VGSNESCWMRISHAHAHGYLLMQPGGVGQAGCGAAAPWVLGKEDGFIMSAWYMLGRYRAGGALTPLAGVSWSMAVWGKALDDMAMYCCW